MLTRRSGLLVALGVSFTAAAGGLSGCGGAESGAPGQPPIGTGDVGEVTGDDGDAGEDGEGQGVDEGLGEADPSCPIDGYEPNDAADHASPLRWAELAGDDREHLVELTVEGRLCASEHDWFTVPIAELGFVQHRLAVDVLVEGASFCGHVDGCEGEALSVGPEHTVGVELYDAGSMVLLAAAVATNGRVDLDVTGPEYGKDLVVHVHSPTRAADFEYSLRLRLSDFELEPDCAC